MKVHHPSQTGVLPKNVPLRISRRPPLQTPLRTPTISKAHLFVPRQPGHLLLHLQKRLKLTPPVHPFRITLRMAPPQRDRPLIQHKMDILRLLSLILIARPISLQRLWRLDYLDIESRAKGRHVRHRKVVFARVLIGGKVLFELG